jgi:putative tricarboxylic transport membrane protein
MNEPVVSGGRSWWLPIVALIAGAAVAFEGWRLPLGQDYAQLGPGFVVLLVGLALIGLGLACGHEIWRGVSYGPEEAEGVDLAAPISRLGLTLSVSAIVTPVVAIPWLGFPLGGALSYTLVTHAFGSRSTVIDGTIGLTVASLTWLGFSRLGVDLGAFFPLKVR